jgi:hypothetical protein
LRIISEKKLAKKNILFFKLIKKTEYRRFFFYVKLVIAKMGMAKPIYIYRVGFSLREKNNKEEYMVKTEKIWRSNYNKK